VQITCIVLAAGASKRLGRPKQLVAFEGQPLVVRAARIAAGVARTIVEIPPDVLITLCDQPLVTSDHLRALIDARAPIAATGYKGISGVPAFFAANFREELLALRGDSGARRVIDAHRDEVVTVPFEPAGFDVDTDAAISL